MGSKKPDLEKIAMDIICDLDSCAREYCAYEFGLPMGDTERAKQKALVLKSLKKIAKFLGGKDGK